MYESDTTPRSGGEEAGPRRGYPWPRRSRTWMIVIPAILVLAAGLAAVWLFFLQDKQASGPPAPVLETQLERPVSGAVIATAWDRPSAVVTAGDRVYVLDTGNNRILDMDRTGAVDAVIGESGESAFLLRGPCDMAVHDGLFYIANTEAGEIAVVSAENNVVLRMPFPVDGAGPRPRPTGVHVTPDGTVYASDWESGRVAIFDANGEFVRYFGEDTVGTFAFTNPTGLTLDADGNLYVAEFSTGGVRKISPQGRQLAVYAILPDNPGVSESTDLVIADNGFLYMADAKRSVVQVFSREARYLGIVGLLDGERIDSPIALLRPWGLAMVGNELFVIDRERGLDIFVIDPAYFTQGATAN
jgi:hypothetical protein